jgi:protein associated with RNAse G/E
LGKERKEIGLEPIVVQTYKFDGVEHRRWRARVVKYERPLLILEAAFEEDIQHDLLGTIAGGTLSTEYYWLNRWYNVFRFCEPDQKLKSFYCNINLPPTFDGEVLSYVDLDIDVLVQPDFSYQVLDLEDFEKHSELYSYTREVREKAQQALGELIHLIEAREFPFTTPPE